MPKRSRNTADLNRLAASIVDEGADEDQDPYEGKNPAAVELGRLGGLKGGRARSNKLTPGERSEIARRAAAARWGKRRPDG
ncbi:MAG: histone H1 [Candidatus Dormibacteria bacterium]